MEFHPAADIFPMAEEMIDDLAKDIKENGQQVPVEVMGGKILDGRRRWRACEKIGVPPKTRTVNPQDPVKYVLSLNLHRRHLDESQRAMVGARARDWYDLEAKKRMSEGGKLGKEKSLEPKTLSKGQANLPDPKKHPSGRQARDEVAKVVSVGGRTIDHATKVIRDGTPELVKAVDQGRISVSVAATVAAKPKEEQVKIVSQDKSEGRITKARVIHSENVSQDQKLANGDNGNLPHKPLGKGIEYAHEAINCLKKVSKNDKLRAQGFQLVVDWIKHNK